MNLEEEDQSSYLDSGALIHVTDNNTYFQKISTTSRITRVKLVDGDFYLVV